MTGEHAIAIARVSAGKQREEDQRPGLKKFADAQGYTLDAMVEIHGKSAYHGKHLKHILKAIETYCRNGDASVVIFRDVDRSSREGAQATYDLRGVIIKAGARMEFAGQEYLNDQRTQAMLLGLLATAAREESETKARRKLQGNARKREIGELIGSGPWGYDPVTERRGSLDVQIGITPNALGREWIERIFSEAVAGKSLDAIADMLRGVPSPQRNDLWNLASIRRIIGNTTYYGMMSSNPNLNFEALVSVELYRAANLAVESRNRHGRGTVVREPALLRPVCGACYGVRREGAPSGVSPLYRTIKLKNGEGDWSYYACRGHGPARKSCGAPVIPVAILDAAVDQTMASDSRPHRERVYVAGDDNSEKRAQLNEKIAAATATGDYALVAQLAQEAAEIPETVKRGRFEERLSGMTVGQHWQTLSLAEKRDELRKWTVIASHDSVRIVGSWHDEEGRTVIGDMIEAEKAP